MPKVDHNTFGSAKANKDPLNSLRRESIDRMKTALLSSSLDDTQSVAFAIKNVTILRVSHQVTRIVQYLDLMDKLEESLYAAIENDIENSDIYDTKTTFKLLSIQEKLQQLIIDSNKLLAPYLEMSQYEAFNQIEVPAENTSEVLAIPPEERHLLRENAGAILEDLEKLEQPVESKQSV